ncbi:MAG: PqqD family protein [Alistipes sp.]|nr:PqqD family protein [Alistipes sp.]
MKIIEGFKLRNVAGQTVITGEGLKQIDFNKLISLNPTAAYLWQQIEDKEFTVETLVELLTSHYEVDEATARQDAEEILQQWHAVGLIEA